jgi:hypothetical protein
MGRMITCFFIVRSLRPVNQVPIYVALNPVMIKETAV